MSGKLTDSNLGTSSRQTPSLLIQSSSWTQPGNPVHHLQHALFGPKMTRPHPKEHLPGGRGRERGQEMWQSRPRETRVVRTRVSAMLAPIGTSACSVSTKCASSAAFRAAYRLLFIRLLRRCSKGRNIAPDVHNVPANGWARRCTARFAGGLVVNLLPRRPPNVRINRASTAAPHKRRPRPAPHHTNGLLQAVTTLGTGPPQWQHGATELALVSPKALKGARPHRHGREFHSATNQSFSENACTTEGRQKR